MQRCRVVEEDVDTAEPAVVNQFNTRLSPSRLFLVASYTRAQLFLVEVGDFFFLSPRFLFFSCAVIRCQESVSFA